MNEGSIPLTTVTFYNFSQLVKPSYLHATVDEILMCNSIIDWCLTEVKGENISEGHQLKLTQEKAQLIGSVMDVNYS